MIDSQTFVKLVKLMKEDYETLGYRSQNFLNAQNLVLEKGFAFEIVHLINFCGREENDIMVEPYVEVEKCIDKILNTNYTEAINVLKFVSEQQLEKLIDKVIKNLVVDSRNEPLEKLYFSEFTTDSQKERLKQTAFKFADSSFCSALIEKGCSQEDFETAFKKLVEYEDNTYYLMHLLERNDSLKNGLFNEEQLNKIYGYLLQDKLCGSQELYEILTQINLPLNIRKLFEKNLIENGQRSYIIDTIKEYAEQNLDYFDLLKGLCETIYYPGIDDISYYLGIDDIMDLYPLAKTQPLQDILIKRILKEKLDMKIFVQILKEEITTQETREKVIQKVIENFNSHDITPRELAYAIGYDKAFKSEELESLLVLVASSEDEVSTRFLINGCGLKSKQKKLICKCVDNWKDENKRKLVRNNSKLSEEEKKLIKVKEEIKTAGEQIAELLQEINFENK